MFRVVWGQIVGQQVKTQLFVPEGQPIPGPISFRCRRRLLSPICGVLSPYGNESASGDASYICRVGQAQRSPTKRFPWFLVGLRKLVSPYISPLPTPHSPLPATHYP